MFANSNASRSFTSLTIDEIRWLNASRAFGEDEDLASPIDPVKPKSPKNARYTDNRRRSILLDDFLGSSNPLGRKTRNTSSRPETPPSSPDEPLPATPPRNGFYSATPSIQEEETVPASPRPTEWLYRQPRSPSSLSRSPSSLSRTPSSISRSASSTRSVTPTPSRMRTRPHTPNAVTEMNKSPFYSTVVPPSPRSPSIRTRPSTPSRSSPNLLEFRGSPRTKASRPQLLPIHRERSGSASSLSTNSSTSSLPRTPPSPSLYSQHYPLPETRATTPTRSILAQSPKRSASISTKHSTSKSVKFNEFISRGDHQATVGDGAVRGEEWNSRLVEGFDVDVDVFGSAPVAQPTKGLKRFLTMGRSRTKHKSRPEISGPFALSATTPTGTPTHHPPDAETQSLFGVGFAPSSPFRYRAPPSASASVSSFLATSSEDAHAPRSKKAYLFNSDELGAVPENRFFSAPSASKATSFADLRHRHHHVHTRDASAPVLHMHTLPSMESFRSAKSTRSCSHNRLRGWLGRIGIGA
ncbi:hypothetical protein MIND_00440900 [Mycena indigotica]|uniref:Uncharacterized protein n=1 Tax=Mycena indigotica TaxID=2126181 RepID=A0A8H6W847_9AGAR|nr:uncharacterized protein MIND_00440900 [Mycena indigotica]KAF7306496.1 hypothetical protein MIND_00440900 [Mycena indigotica]